MADRLDEHLALPTPFGEPVPRRDERATRDGETRATHHVAQAGPNAPQLIRLIRFPYALQPARTRRVTVIPPPEVHARVDVAAERDAALAERERVRFTSPARGRVRPFASRPSAADPIPPLPDDGDPR